MAIEAANQLSPPARQIKGFKLTDTYFKVALAIPASAQGIETQLVFNPTHGGSDKNNASWRFQLFSNEGAQWQEHSHGTIQIDYEQNPNDLEGQEDLETLKHAQATYRAVGDSASFRRTKDQFYDSAFKSGYNFGPAFRAMDNVICSEGTGRQAIASINCFDWKEADNRNHFQEHVVHPVTLDGILQVSIAAFIRTGEDITLTAIPAEIEHIWVSKDGLSSPRADMVKSAGTLVEYGNVGYGTSVIALDNSLSKVLVEAKGIKMRFVTGVAPAQDDAQRHHQCHSIEWKPDIDLLMNKSHALGVNSQTQAVEYERSLTAAQSLLVNFLGLATFKKPDMKVLHMADSEEDFGIKAVLEELFQSQQEGAGPTLPCSELVFSLAMPPSTSTNTYDLVVNSCESMLDSLHETRRLIKPGGRLALILGNGPKGAASKDIKINGYHRDDDTDGHHVHTNGRSHNLGESEALCVEPERALERAGFIHVLQSATDTTNVAVLISASRPHNVIVPKTFMEYVLVIQATPFQEEIAKCLRSKFDTLGRTCTTCYLDQLTNIGEDSQRVLIFIPELERPLLQSPTSAEFLSLRDALVSTKGLLWLTGRDKGGLLPPATAMADGLTRVLRSENAQAIIVTAALAHAPIADQAEHIMTMIQATKFETANKDYETSYVQVDDNFHIERLKPMADLAQTVFKKSSPYHSKVIPFKEAPPLRLAVGTPGLLDSLYFEQDISVEEPLSPGLVEIQVTDVGLNFKDLLLALGRENGTTFGNECAGVISRIGKDTPFKVGDRVCVFSPTAFSTYVRARAEHVARVPDQVSLSHAAAVPTQFVTAWYAIHNAAKMQKGESILIHSAAGGTGQAALQISQLLGCEVFATVGSEEKKRFLVNRYRIPEDHIFNSRSTSFAQGILRLTNSRGVDVIINSLSGEGLFASWNIIAPHGRFIELGKKDIAANSSLPMRPFLRRATFTALEIGAMAADFGALGKELIDNVLSMFIEGSLRPVENFDVLPISHLKEGMRALQSGKSIGKIVFNMADDAPVPVSRPSGLNSERY
jgi:NADPH:quinone reductase-like Zn-dependent oxidoreductase/SAM-dependent methyltransferase